MTNILILGFILLQTNTLPYGATDEFGGWSPDITWNVDLTYVAPTNTVVAVEATYNAEGSHCNNNGCYGMRWTLMNCGGVTTNGYNGLGAYPTQYPYPRGFYTNDISSTNTIRVPFPAENDKFFFRLRKFST